MKDFLIEIFAHPWNNFPGTGTNDIRTNSIRTNGIRTNSRGTNGIRDKQYTRTNGRGDKEYTGQTVYRTNSILGHFIKKRYTII